MLKVIMINIITLGSVFALNAGPREVVTKALARATSSVTSTIDTKWSNLMTQVFTEPLPGKIIQYAHQTAICNYSTPPCSTNGHCFCRQLRSNLTTEEIQQAHKYLELTSPKDR